MTTLANEILIRPPPGRCGTSSPSWTCSRLRSRHEGLGLTGAQADGVVCAAPLVPAGGGSSRVAVWERQGWPSAG